MGEDDEEERSIIAIYPLDRQPQKICSASARCTPFKQEKLEEEMKDAYTSKSRPTALLSTLRSMNISTYVVSCRSADMLKEIRQVVQMVCRDRQSALINPQQHCLLYYDHQGRLMNRMVAPDAVGPVSGYNSLQTSFSSTQALMAFVVLARSFPCVFEEEGSLRPTYVSFILGLVLYEEIACSWLHAQLLVRALPSMAAYSLTTWVGNDWLRKILLFLLAISGSAAADPDTQTCMTISGLALACCLLLANLGARTWARLSWNEPRYHGVGADSVTFLLSVITGFALPHLANPTCQSRDLTRSLEAVLTSAVIVLVTF